MNSNPNVLILLSTYQGEKYLADQLDSLISQTYPHWTLLIRDDSSTDNTTLLIKKYIEIDHRIHLIEDQLGNIKPIKSFSVLMQHALNRDENFIFFCDQDDVWLPDKLSVQTALLQSMEQQFGHDTPLLVHSDLRVVDSQLHDIHPSFLQYEKINRNVNSPLHTLLINNFVTGCTVGINRILLEQASPIPDQVVMHDWWCALCAAASGKIDFISQPTVLYRQHQNNTIGSGGFYGKLKSWPALKKLIQQKKKNMQLCFKQAEALSLRLPQDHPHHVFLNQFSQLPSQNKFARYQTMRDLSLRATNSVRMLLFMVFL